VAVWASDMALVSILEMLATGVCTTVGSDVVTLAGELGHATGAVIAGLGSSSSGGTLTFRGSIGLDVDTGGGGCIGLGLGLHQDDRATEECTHMVCH
jgi:hypothetical protein